MKIQFLNQMMERLKEKKINSVSPAGNRTPVSRVTGGDTHHYTTEDSAENKGKY